LREQIDIYYQQNAGYLWIESGSVGENMNLYFASEIRNYLESVQYTKAPNRARIKYAMAVFNSEWKYEN